MSVVKTVKGRKSLLAALEQVPKDKSKWWEHKQKILEQWLETSPDELGVEGAVKMIRSQLERGVHYPHLRFKCWKHIVIELSALLEDDNSTVNPQLLRRRSSVSSRNNQDDPAEDEGTNTEDDNDLSALSFVERQEAWLRRKQNSLKARAMQMERQAKDTATFNPNVARSQGSMRPAQMSAVEKKLEQQVADAERVIRKTSFQEARRSSFSKDNGDAPVSNKRRNSNTKSRRRSSTEGDILTPRRATAPPSTLKDLPPFGGAQAFEDDGSDGSAEDMASQQEGGPVGMGPEAEDGEGEGPRGEGEEEEKEEEEDPFESGSFFYKVDDKGKGHYKVRDASRFLLTSMYKRKDRVTRTPGVSLLVGKLEEPPHEEKVISAIFDTDRFTEKAAAEWWELNGHRFEDAKSLAEKEEMQAERERFEERKRQLRRYSAPAAAAAAAVKARSGSSHGVQVLMPGVAAGVSPAAIAVS